MTKVEAIKKFLKIMAGLPHGKLSTTRLSDITPKQKYQKNGLRAFVGFYIVKLKTIEISRKLTRALLRLPTMTKINFFYHRKIL